MLSTELAPDTNDTLAPDLSLYDQMTSTRTINLHLGL